MSFPIYYVGTPAEVEHHARPLLSEFEVRIEDAKSVVRHARAGDVCLFYNEFFPRYRLANHQLREKQCATLYVLDGILEWRNMWDFPPGIASLWTLRPILSHKLACIGQSQARILESWQYGDQCEIVGIPRLDRLRGREPRQRPAGEPFTILIVTSKCPGFDEPQLQRTTQSLIDLKSWFEANSQVGGMPVRPVWRITQGLDKRAGVENSLRDTTGAELAEVLTRVDAVITTPSTAMLEGMLFGLPVTLLDYHNCPHYVPAAWRISAQTHLDQIMAELVSPPPEKMHYQQHLLFDALECASPALPRLCELIEQMRDRALRCVADSQPVSFSPHLLHRPTTKRTAAGIALDYAEMFPENPTFAEYDVCRLQAQVADLREKFATSEVERTRVEAQLKASDESAHALLSKLDAEMQRMAAIQGEAESAPPAEQGNADSSSDASEGTIPLNERLVA